MAKLHIVALGSSYAAGPGIQPIINAAAQRSGNNYPHQLAKKLDADLIDLTVSGATLQHVLCESQVTIRGDHFPPQLSDFPSHGTDIVLITGGGNDLGYVGGMMYDSLLASKGEEAGMLQEVWEKPDTSLLPEKVVDRFTAVVDKIKRLAPKAMIYLVDYQTVLGDATRPAEDLPLSEKQIRHHRERAGMLSDCYRKAAESISGVVLFEASKLSEGHEIGSPEPWMEGFTIEMVMGMMQGKGPTPFHPNLAGHTAIAEELYKQIATAQSST